MAASSPSTATWSGGCYHDPPLELPTQGLERANNMPRGSEATLAFHLARVPSLHT